MLEAATHVSREPLSLPTLFVSECVLVYVEATASNNLLKWIAQSFASCAVVVYEQILPNDAFGLMMKKNLAVRGEPFVLMLCVCCRKC